MQTQIFDYEKELLSLVNDEAYDYDRKTLAFACWLLKDSKKNDSGKHHLKTYFRLCNAIPQRPVLQNGFCNK